MCIMKRGIKVIGLMSGTSLDGLDLCYASFEYDGSKWSYKVIDACDEQYSDELKMRLATAQNMSAYEYALLNAE